MNGTLWMLDDLASVWGDAIWRACWQGGLVILLVWTVCWLLKKLPPNLRCWTWRLAYVKLLVVLVWTTPIVLPLLPAAVELPVSTEGAVSGGISPAAEQAAEAGAVSHVASGSGGAAVSAPALFSLVSSPSSCLLVAWIVGVGCCLGNVFFRWLTVRRLCSRAEDVALPQVCASLARLSRQLGIRRVPALRCSTEATTPLLLGWMRPVIVLPPACLEEYTPAELRLALSHELAHLKRRDLIWSFLATIVGALYFFHPLAWLARREWLLAQESACDEMAIRASRAPAAVLGRLLLKIAAQLPPLRTVLPLTANVGGSFSLIERRLVAMKNFHGGLKTRGFVAGLLVALAGVLVIVPWRVVAQEGKQKAPAASGGQQAPAAVEKLTGREALEAMADGCQRNSDSFRFFTCRFEVVRQKADTIEDALKGDFHEPTTRIGQTEYGLWLVNGEKVRFDLTNDEATLKATREKMRSPEPQDVTPQEDGSNLMSIPGSAHYYLANAEFTLRYGPVISCVNIANKKVHQMGIRRTPLDMDTLLKGGIATPAWSIRTALKGEIVPSFDGSKHYNGRRHVQYDGTEEVNGVRTMAASVGPTPDSMMMKYFLDPRRGFLPVHHWSRDPRTGEKMLALFITDVKECSGGRWFPMRSVVISNPDSNGPFSVTEFKVTKLDVDNPPPDDQFYVDVAAGTQVSVPKEPRLVNLKQDERIGLDQLKPLYDRCELRR